MAKRIRRSFTAQFKAEVVLAILSGSQSMAELCRQNNLKPELVSLWKKTLLSRLPNVFDGPTLDSEAAARVGELERLVGQLTLELAVAKKVSALLPSRLASGGRS
jgi:transposase